MNRGMWALLASSGTLLALSATLTSAVFTDSARLSFGVGGVPFDIAIESGGALYQAQSESAAVLEPVVGSRLSATKPVSFDTTVVNRAGSREGDMYIRLWDPDPSAGDVFDSLLITIYIDGTTTAIRQLSVVDVNAHGPLLQRVKPGEIHDVTVEALLSPAGEALTAAEAKVGTAIGLRVDGVSR
ncbi:MAG: hypothetical protein LBR21_09260 [Propionibacteriaceae bacterium]|nr:hypothetical protein [Propionibacteriaceae bacterium]